MNTNRRPDTRKKMSLALRARRFARENAAVVTVLAIVVAVGVTAVFMRRVLAAKLQVRVLDCPVAHAVAHHHNESCYDDEGKLVCMLPERDQHTHNESCYERQLTCGLEEGEAHVHDESCYDEQGNLVCGLQEGQAHVHSEDCYADVLVCGKEEVTEEHTHGDGCFRVIAANEDAPEMTHPGTVLSHEVRNEDRELEMRVDATAPVGALPDGARMDVELIDPAKVDLDLLQQALDEHADEQGVDADHGRILHWQAVRINFLDAEGREIEPEGDVTVKLTSDIAKTDDVLSVVRMDNPEGAGRVLKRGERKARKDGEATERVMEQLTDEQLEASKIKLAEDQLAFEATESNAYVVTTTSGQHEMDATDGSTVTIDVKAAPEAGIPAEAALNVVRMSPGTDEYDECVHRSVEAMGADQADVAMAQFFDIKIVDGAGNEIQPQAPVDVQIELTDIPEAPNGFAAVHFRQAGEDGKTELEQLECGGQDGTITFSADSFSVYGIVYTVDFGYEVEGQLYEYTLEGGGSMGLRDLVDKLHIYEGAPKSYESAEAFMEEVADVEFSDPSCIWVQRVESETTLQNTLNEYGLQPQYSAGTTEGQIEEYGKASYEKDWVLVSLRPFTTTEMLTITMTDGSQRLVAVTDAQDDGEIEAGGGTRAAGDGVTTIQNPADIRIDLIDYWVDDDLKDTPAINTDNYNDNNNRRVWPNWSTRYEGGNDNIIPWNQSVIGSGWNQGINGSSPATSGTYGEHNLKFNPSNAVTVPDGRYENGRFSDLNNNTDGTMALNSWSGSRNSADGPNPYQGIVQNKLNDAGYPTLVNDPSKGADGEPLDYLFDDSYHAGKQKYPNVNNLLVVNSDGYYTFDSAEYDARFEANPNYKPNFDPSTDNPSDAYSGSFKLTEQGEVPTNSQGNPNNNVNGFWPFGNRVYWHGMHVQADFSMPGEHNRRKGQVLTPNGDYEDMKFVFTGDDDTWVYIDGILVGDAGGVHNKTTISINFADGTVQVVGANGALVNNTNLKAIFQAAANRGEVSQDYMQKNFEPGSNTFKATTHHEFDMFYLERGGGESNLKLTFNLVTTADFNAHKAYNGKNGKPLQTDDFAFEMIGLDGECSYTLEGPGGDRLRITLPGEDDEGYSRRAVMPESIHYAPADSIVHASVAEPFYNPNTSLELSDGTTATGQIYATGVQADGYVNFGTADTSDLAERMAQSNGQLKPAYRYIVREIIPDTAVNPYGKNWYECTDEERRQDGFVGTGAKDLGILYSGETYYMVGYLKEENGEYKWKKKYFKNDDYAEQANEVQFIDFKNRYATELTPLQLNVHKINEENKQLPGVQFRLHEAMFDSEHDVWVDYVAHPNIPRAPYDSTLPTNENGDLSFGNLQPGYYILEETATLPGYELPRNKWLVTVHRVDWAVLANGNRKPYSEVKENDNVTGLYSECEASVMQLTLDGAEIPNSTDPNTTISTINGIPQFTKEIVNTQFQFNVEKHWDGIKASHDAIGVNGDNDENETQVKVTLGRYTIQDIAGTLNINKYGVPALANTKITYNVYKSVNGAQGERVAGPFTEETWDNTGTTSGGDTFTSIASISLPPGDYIVTETVEEDDPKYNAIHPGVAEAGDRVTIQGNTTIVTIEDEKTTEANYTSEYAPKVGKLYIKSNFSDTSGLVNPSTMGITYTVTDNAGNDVYDVNGTKVGPFSYDDVKNGLETGDVLIGRYKVTESGWTDVTGTARTHTPAQSGGSTTISELVTDGSRADYVFTTTYVPKTSTDVYLVLYHYYENDGTMGLTQENTFREYGRFAVEGDSLTLTFACGTCDPIVGKAYLDTSLTSSLGNMTLPNGDWRTGYTLTIDPDDLGSDHTIYLGNKWGANAVVNEFLTLTDGTTTWNLENMDYDTPGNGGRGVDDDTTTNATSSSDGAKSRSVSLKTTKSAAKKRGAATQRGIQPGEETIEKTNNAPVPNNAGEGKKYVEDRVFGMSQVVYDGTNEGNVVVLTQNPNDLDDTADPGNTIWRKLVKGLPSMDRNGNKYYYFVKSVEELNMPKNTTCTIGLDNDGKQILTYKLDDGSDAQTLTVSNKVGTPADIDILKVEAASDGTYTNQSTRLDGAVFRLQQKVTTTTPPEHEGDAPTTSTDWVVVKDHKVVKADDQSEEITVNQTTGDFTVPAGGATVLLLDPGDYRLVEVTPPSGYIMVTTNYEFTIGQNGRIVHDASGPAHVTGDYEVTVGNTPGQELPMSGGPGTLLGTIAGVLLMAAGALMLVHNRRAATVEVGEER